MFWMDVLFVVAFALLLSGLLTWGLGWRHPAQPDAFAGSLVFLFVILLLAMWTGGAWLKPWGPVAFGTPWLSLLLVGAVVSLLVLAVANPPRSARRPREGPPGPREGMAVAAAFGFSFWLLILGLLAASIARYAI